MSIRFVFALVLFSAVPAMAEYSQSNPYGGGMGQGYQQPIYSPGIPQQGYPMGGQQYGGGQYGQPQQMPYGMPLGGYGQGYGGDHGGQQFAGGCGQPMPRPTCGGRRGRRYRRHHGAQQGCGQSQGHSSFAMNLSFGFGASMY